MTFDVMRMYEWLYEQQPNVTLKRDGRWIYYIFVALDFDELIKLDRRIDNWLDNQFLPPPIKDLIDALISSFSFNDLLARIETPTNGDKRLVIGVRKY